MTDKHHHRKVDCSSESSSGYCGNGCYDNGCVAPFQPLANVFDVSSIKCSTNDCGSQAPSDLCSDDELSKCPELSHCVKKPKHPKKHRKDKKDCGECGFKKCQCKISTRDWSAVLCGSSSSDDCSDSSDDCKVPVPIAPCNVAKAQFWEPSCHSDSSSSDSSCSPKKHKKAHKGDCPDCCYPLDRCRCKSQVHHKRPGANEFFVTLGPKNGHPWEHRIMGREAFHVDKIPGRAIHVKLGQTYRFHVKGNAGNRFYFTHDVQGGKRGVQADSPLYDPVHLHGTPAPVADGFIELKVTSDLPKRFYYQSRDNNCLGGDVHVHSK